MEPGKSYLVHVLLDPVSGRIIASSRISRHLDRTPHTLTINQAVDLIIFGQTALGYKAVVNGAHSGLLFADGVFQPLQPGERVQGYVAKIRPDGKLDLTLHAPGRAKVSGLEAQILAELQARGGYWGIGDHSTAAEIHAELGVSKRTFKQALGGLLKKGQLSIEPKGIRLN